MIYDVKNFFHDFLSPCNLQNYFLLCIQACNALLAKLSENKFIQLKILYPNKLESKC